MHSILFFAGWHAGKDTPFVRVPATVEGLRYAGYMLAYWHPLGVPPTNHLIHMATDSVLSAEEIAAFQLGYHEHPNQPQIPLGAEREVDGAWARLTDQSRTDLGDGWYWVIVPRPDLRARVKRDPLSNLPLGSQKPEGPILKLNIGA